MINTLKEFARDSARRYLQSVVFVDDEIFDIRSGMAIDITDLPQPRKPVLRAETAEATTQADQEKQDATEVEEHYHPKELVSSFAREGIICALYEPPEGFSTNPDSEIFKLCERPDIIILDWDFSNDKGEKALELIAALVKQSHQEFPHHTRLLSIYTNDQSLVAVANKIADRLRKDNFEVQPEASQCRLRSGATRLVVFGKNIARFGRDEEEFTVSEAELANRLIDEFADMNSGILPAYALHGMAAIRQNSKRILDRFHGALNGAFLLHRAFSQESEEAFDQLPALLSEELQAVLEDKHIDVATVARIAIDAIGGLKLNSPRGDWHYVDGRRFPATHYVAAEVLNELLTTGHVDSTKYPSIEEVVEVCKEGFRGIGANLMQDLITMVDTEKSHANERLASLFASRTQYDEETRQLSYGTIVRHQETAGERWIYSFCLMPICDSLRLDQARQHKQGQPVRFPFWILRADVFSGANISRRGLALTLHDNSHVLLSAGGKPRDMMWLTGFAVNLATGTVTANRNENGRFLFVADGNREIEWVGQLKALHAQRIAHDIGQSLSRVGLVEAEWLRLLCDR